MLNLYAIYARNVIILGQLRLEFKTLLTPAAGSSLTTYCSFSAGPSAHCSDASSQKLVRELCCSSDCGTDEGVAKASVKAIGPSGHDIDHFGECYASTTSLGIRPCE